MPPSALLLTILSPYILSAMADSAPSSLPQVDFSRMGSVGIGGSFSGLEWYSSSSSSTPFSSDGDTVFARTSNGFQPLGSTDAGGVIHALCWSNSSASGTLYIGGSFTSISGTISPNFIAYSLSNSTFSALPSGLPGPVNTLYCDNANDHVWAGGSFPSNVALWSTSSLSFSPVPFGGLNGPVETITPGSTSLYFGGHLTTSFASNTASSGNISSSPSAPANTSTTGNSGYLTPVSLPASSTTGNLTIAAGPSTNQSQYSDPNVLVCPGQGAWLAEDHTISNVDILSYNWVRSTGARVSNGLIEGRGTTGFW